MSIVRTEAFSSDACNMQVFTRLNGVAIMVQIHAGDSQLPFAVFKKDMNTALAEMLYFLRSYPEAERDVRRYRDAENRKKRQNWLRVLGLQEDTLPVCISA